MSARVQAQTSQIKRQTQCTKHQVRTACSIRNHVHSGAESTDKDTYDNRSACQSQLHRSAYTRNSNRDSTQGKSQDNTNKYSHEIRFFQALHCISQYSFHILYSSGLTYYRQPVAQLQGKLCRSQQQYSATIYTADIDSIMIAQMKRTQFLSVQFRTCHHNAL